MCTKDLARSRQIALIWWKWRDGLGRFTTRKVDTYNGWYWLCDILIYFWLKFCFDRWLSSVRGRAIVHIQKSIVPSSSSCVYVAVCADS